MGMKGFRKQYIVFAHAGSSSSMAPSMTIFLTDWSPTLLTVGEVLLVSLPRSNVDFWVCSFLVHPVVDPGGLGVIPATER